MKQVILIGATLLGLICTGLAKSKSSDSQSGPPFETAAAGAPSLQTFCAPKEFRTIKATTETPKLHICHLVWFLHYINDASTPAYEVTPDKALDDLQKALKINLVPIVAWHSDLFAYIFVWEKPADRNWQKYVFCNYSESNHHRTPSQGGWYVRFNFDLVTTKMWSYLMGGMADGGPGTTETLDIGEWVRYDLVLKKDLPAAIKTHACLQKPTTS
jgi:hypothetical protein